MGRNLRVEALLDAVPRGATILDIGCVQHSVEKETDEDWVHARLYDIGAEVVGVDYLREEVEALQNRGYNVVHGDAEALDLDEQFEAVVAGELIEHLSNVGQFLDGVHEHLEPDGQFVLTTPNPWAFHRFKQALLGDVFANPEHACWFDERTLRQLFARHGFEIERLNYVKASDPGVTSALYDLGFEVLGGTSLLVVARPVDD
jgi:2-polyprenyl-3-methyl-5-hydroxy-6-metoxy-1,4-benzoquinol methylase